MAQLSISQRTRRTPFSDRVEEAGVKGYTVYNHMLLATVYRSLEEDYHHLKNAVQIWDVACERQVELRGPDAGRLAQLMTPRDLSQQRIGQCLYSPTCDQNGYLLNDPVTIKLEEDRYWVSIADSDVILFARGLAAGFGLKVQIEEPDIFPLAIQGPKADELMSRVFGPKIRETRFFGTQIHQFAGEDHLIARSGYSGQGGFEIYVNGTDAALPLWDALMEAGRDLDVHPGCPNLIERIESGLLSYGNDMNRSHTLHETGLARFCKSISPDCLAVHALKWTDVTQKLCYVTVDGPKFEPLQKPMTIFSQGVKAGQINSAVWSPDFQTNVAVGMIQTDHLSPGAHLVVGEDNSTINILNGPIALTQDLAA